MNLTVGTQSPIQRIAVRLGGVEACSQTFNPPLAPTQNTAVITCPVNTAQLNATTGAPIFPNGTYELTAVAFSTASSAAPVATATYGNLILANANVVGLTITTTGVSSTTGTTIGQDGTVWREGNVVVTATPSIFTGGNVNGAVICIDVPVGTAAPGTPNGQECKAGTAGTNGTYSATFNKAEAFGPPDNGVNNVSNSQVSAFVASTTTSTGTVGPTAPLNVNSPSIKLDNTAPTFNAAFPASVTNGFINSGFTFSSTNGAGNGTQTVTNALDPQPGVGNVTVTYHVVQTSTVAGLGATAADQDAAIVANGQNVTAATQLPSNVANDFYTLVVRARDGLGNTTVTRVGTFGVDVGAPTNSIANGSQANNSTINNGAAGQITVNSADDFSGTQFVRGRITGHSVLEVDADAGTEIRCYDNAGGQLAMPTSGICPTFDIPVTGTTQGQGIVNVPADQNFYVIDMYSVDRAGNTSATTTRNVLRDAVLPNGAITTSTVSGTSVSISGQITDNIDLAAYDVRFRIPGAIFPVGTTNTQYVPFAPATTVDTYGLPLTGIATASGSNSVGIRELNIGTAVAPVMVAPDGIGFGIRDVAGNFNWAGQVYGAGAGNGIAGLDAFAVSGSPATICRTGTNGACGNSINNTSTTLSAVATTAAAVNASPIAATYFYYVNSGADATLNTADDYLTLIGSTTANTVSTGPTQRTWTFQQAITAASFPRTGTFTVWAIGVDSEGDAIRATNTVVVL
jgi:hypothetical protein